MLILVKQISFQRKISDKISEEKGNPVVFLGIRVVPDSRRGRSSRTDQREGTNGSDTGRDSLTLEEKREAEIVTGFSEGGGSEGWVS